MCSAQLEKTRVEEVFVALAAAVTIAAFLIHELYDLDIWWHLAIGRDVLATGSIPKVDRYSVAGLGRVYHDSHWLFQVLLASVNRAVGMVGVQLAEIAIWAATLAAVYHACRRWAGIAWSAGLVFLAAMSSVERFLPRPEIVTFLMLAIFYDRMQRSRFGSWRELGLLAILQVLWTNSHGLFVLGPCLIGCYWLAALPPWLRRRQGDLAALSRAAVVVLTASWITPFGLAGWRYAVLLFQEGGVDRPLVFQNLGELGPVLGPSFRSSPAFWFFAVLVALASITGAAAAARRRLHPARVLILLLTIGLALTGRRNVVLFALVAAPFIAEAGRGWFEISRQRARWLHVGAAVFVLAFAAYPLSGAFYVQMELPARFGLGITPSFFPHGLPKFLDVLGFEERVLQSNTLGGYYLYHGFPERLPLTDGRWEVYDEEELDWILQSSRQPQRWQHVVRRYGLSGVLLAHTSPEARAVLPEISRSANWMLAYYDVAASFWIARDAARELQAVSLKASGTLPELRRVDDGLILNAFLAGVGARALQKVNLERTVEFGWREGWILEQLGRVEIDLQQFEEAEETFSKLLDRDRDSLPALNELAFLAFRRGDYEVARGLISRAIELQPDNHSLLENLERIDRRLASSEIDEPESGE